MDVPILTFQRVAITEQQIIDHGLPTKPVKATQSRKRYDIDQTVEAEAMPPAALREIVAHAFEPMIAQRQMRRTSVRYSTLRYRSGRLTGQAPSLPGPPSADRESNPAA